jgi:very-short-patch-repair endonuclease
MLDASALAVSSRCVMKYNEKMSSRDGVVLRSELLAQGHGCGYIDHAVKSGRLIRIHRGIYVDAAAEDLATSRMRAHLVGCGPLSVVSHDSAAALHRFDSTHGYSETVYITAPRSSGVRGTSPGLVISHSTMLEKRDVVDGFPVTTRARTLLDVSASMSDIECERVLESAIRGVNPKRPDRWRNEVLDDVVELITSYPRHPGASRIRRVLISRPGDCRPTGSFPETVLVQALRNVGIAAIRQPTVVVIDDRGRQFEYFPDLLIVGGRCIVEVDGGSHLTPTRARTDAARQNRLIGFDVFRYPATTVLNDPTYAVAELVTHVKQVKNQSTTWEISGRRVSGDGSEWTIVTAK